MHLALVVLHTLGACVWAGGHLVLAIGVLPAALKARDPEIVRAFESRYEPVGLSALAVQVFTGIMLALPYFTNGDAPVSGHVIGSLGAKGVLLLATIGLALHARLRLVPRLTPQTLPALAAHIVAVTVIAVLFVVIGVGLQLAAA